jgi:hypothetical protein
MDTRELMDTYSTLARRTQEDYDLPNLKGLIDETRAKYPLESANLTYSDEPDWHNGFNSGMLACLRLVSCARIYPQNMEEFPVLDT